MITQQEREQALEEYLEQVSLLIKKGHPLRKSLEEVLLDEGKKPVHLPFTVEEEKQILRLARGSIWPVKECYRNAAQLAIRAKDLGIEKANYAEGLGISHGVGINFPFEHALLLLNDKPVDLTWRSSKTRPKTPADYLEIARINLGENAYRVLEFSTELVTKLAIAHGSYGPITAIAQGVRT